MNHLLDNEIQMQEVFNEAQGIEKAFESKEIDMDIETSHNVDMKSTWKI